MVGDRAQPEMQREETGVRTGGHPQTRHNGLDGQPRSSFGPPSSEDSPPVLGAHAFSEAMLAFFLEV